MKKWIILLVMLWAGNCWGATYYVSTTGSNTPPYDTPAKAATLTATAIDYIQASGGAGPHTVYVAAGTYNSSMYFDHANHAGLTVVGAGRGQTILAPASTTPITTAGGTGSNNISVSGMTIKAGAGGYSIYKSADATGWTFSDCDVQQTIGATEDMVESVGGAISFYRCRFFQDFSTAAKYVMDMTGDTSTTISYCQVLALGTGRSPGGLRFRSTGTHTVANSVVGGAALWGISNESGITNVYNSVISAGVENKDVAPLQKTGGALNAYNNILISSGWNPDLWVNAALDVDSGNIKTNANPLFKSHARGGFILFGIDDYYDYVEVIEPLLSARGMKGTYFVNYSNYNTDDNAAMRTMLARGTIEVGCHGRTHTDLAYDHALNFSQAGGANCTVALAAGTITLNCDGTDYDNSLDTTLAANDTLGEIITALNGVKGWTVAKSTTGGQSADHIVSGVLATSFLAQGATAEPCDIDFDRTGHTTGLYKDEVADVKSWLENTVIGSITDPQTGAAYAARSFSTPFGAYDATAKAALSSAGFIFAKGWMTGEVNPESAPCLIDIDPLNMKAILSAGTAYLVGADEATTRANARAFAFMVAENGLAVSVNSHEVAETTVEQWGWILDEWAEFNELTVTSHQIFYDTISAVGSGWTDDGDGTFSRGYATFSDFSLSSSTSPAINAGVFVTGVHDVAGVTDYAGQDLYNMPAPDIGAYGTVKSTMVLKGGSF